MRGHHIFPFSLPLMLSLQKKHFVYSMQSPCIIHIFCYVVPSVKQKQWIILKEQPICNWRNSVGSYFAKSMASMATSQQNIKKGVEKKMNPPLKHTFNYAEPSSQKNNRTKNEEDEQQNFLGSMWTMGSRCGRWAASKCLEKGLRKRGI